MKKRSGTLLVLALEILISSNTFLHAENNGTPEQKSIIHEELLVTGSSIKGVTKEDIASPIQQINRKAIKDLGLTAVSEIVNTLTINTGSENNADAFTQNFTTGTSNINLRGLGVASTLVLLNGRRQTFSAFATDRGENFVDTTSLVPLIALERIEILKGGASSLYGSDAVAGVANFYTRKNFSGLELQIDTQTGIERQDEVTIAGIFGTGNDKAHIVTAFSYFDHSGLSTADKRLSNATDDTSRAGFPGTFLVPTQPVFPNLDPVTQANLIGIWNAAFNSAGNVPNVADSFEELLGFPAITGAIQPVFADLDCENIASNDDITLPPSTFPVGICQSDLGDFFSITPEEERSKIFTSLEYKFSDSLVLDTELSYANNLAERRNSPSFPITSTPIICGDGSLDAAVGSSCATLGAHPNNPFGVDVFFIGRILGSGSPAEISRHDSDTMRVASNLSGNIKNTWSWGTSISHSENRFKFTVTDTLATEFQNALFGLGGSDCVGAVGVDIFPGVGPCEYFNPFGSSIVGTGTSNSQAIIDYITDEFTIDAKSDLTTIDAYASGDIFKIQSNAANIGLGIQLRRERLSFDYDAQSNAENFLFTIGNPDFSANRNIKAAFSELVLPITNKLDIQVALRAEDYNNEFSSIDPKIGFLWKPNNSFIMRSTFSSAFRAPSLFQQNGIQTNLQQISAIGQTLAIRAQPNPNDTLQPEEADNINIGFSWKSKSTTLDVDYWSFEYDNVIIQQNPNALVFLAAGNDGELGTDDDNAIARSQILFNGSVDNFNIERINVFYDNASTLDTNGIDINFRYIWETKNLGEYQFTTGLTKVLKYDLVDPIIGKIDGAGSRNFNNFSTSVPTTRSNISLAWAKGSHSANFFINYISSYSDDQNNGDKINSNTRLNLQYNYLFKPLKNSTEGIKLSMGGINITDEDPPRVATNGGYDSKVHDPRGALFYIKTTIPF